MNDLRSRVRFGAVGRRLGRRWGVTAGVSAAFLGMATVAAPIVFAEEPPQRALQAVTVALGNDGAVNGLTSALVSRGQNGEKPTTRTRALNPAEHAGDLPVRVTTSWRHDGKVGTDLSQLKGASGLVEINLTVQNTTTHPERFQYDAAGVARESYELVSTPMTVVASATLPKNTAPELVRSQPGAAEPGTTNGVVSGDDKSTTVQWASLLAPPRLAPSTTFTLVQNAKNFQLPHFNLAVQPGLATDNSIARLVGDVFGGSAAVVGSENNTIGLIASVNATLAQVTDSLQTVQQTLSVNAGQVGAAATAALTATAGSVDTAMASLLADLKALDDSVGVTVKGTNSRATSALDESVRGVLDFFGSPAAGQGPVVPTACGDQTATEAPSNTLLGQLSTVSSQLRGLATASADCVRTLRTTLQASIGDASTVCPAGASDGPLVCRLTEAGGKLTGLATTLGTQVTSLRTLTDPASSRGLGARVQQLVDAITKAQDAAGVLSGARPAGPGVQTALTTLDTALQTALDSVQTMRTDVSSDLTALGAKADERLSALGTEAAITAQMTTLATAVCAAQPSPDASVVDPRDVARRQIDNGLCADTTTLIKPSPVTPSLKDRLLGDVAAWAEVNTIVDRANGRISAVQTALTALTAPRNALRTAVDRLTVSAPNVPSLDKAIGDVLTGLTALYDPAHVRDGQACAPVPAGTTPPAAGPPVNALADVYDCTQSQLLQLVSGLDTSAQGVNGAGAQDIKDATVKAAEAGTKAGTSLGDLSTGLGAKLNASADQQLAQGKAVVAAQTARLQAVQAAAKQELDAAAQDAVGRLAEQITSATTQQSAAADSLQKQLQKVLLDLGSAAQGRGLLGVMQNSAGQTGVRTTQVQETSKSASSFRSVRVAEVADAQLEQQQLARSLQAAQRYGTFVEKLPAGSTCATVFIYRLGDGV